MKALDSLRIFVATQRKGSLSAAARSLSLSPATISRRISALEEELGVQLGPALTPSQTRGVVLYVRDTVACSDDLVIPLRHEEAGSLERLDAARKQQRATHAWEYEETKWVPIDPAHPNGLAPFDAAAPCAPPSEPPSAPPPQATSEEIASAAKRPTTGRAERTAECVVNSMGCSLGGHTPIATGCPVRSAYLRAHPRHTKLHRAPEP